MRLSKDESASPVESSWGRRVVLWGVLAFVVGWLTCGVSVGFGAVLVAGPGVGAGQVDDPVGVTVDQGENGLLIVGEAGGRRIDEVAGGSRFSLAFGAGVRTGGAEFQTCTSATGCVEGGIGSAAGDVQPDSVAVEEVASRPTYRDVYVAEAVNDRVQVFKTGGGAAEFVLMFGKGVDPGPNHPGDVCTAQYEREGDKCRGGAEFHDEPGEVGDEGPVPVAIDRAGDVWVGSIGRVERFSPEGVFLSELMLSGVTSVFLTQVSVNSLAVDAAGDVYVHRIVHYKLTAQMEKENKELEEAGKPKKWVAPAAEPVAGVEEYDSGGKLVRVLDGSGHANAVALDPATGDVFVSDQPENTGRSGAAKLLVFNGVSGAELEVFGAGEVIGEPFGNALAFGEKADGLYVASGLAEELSAVQLFVLPAPGPLCRAGASAAFAVGKTSSGLEAEVNPEGKPTNYQFEYISEAEYRADGESFGAGTVHVPPAPAELGSEDFEFHRAAVAIATGGLQANTKYVFRVVPSNSNGTVPCEAIRFATLPPADVESTSVSDVSSGSATLEAAINPLGDATSYHFEYINDTGYQEDGGSFSGPAPAARVPIPDAGIGAGNSPVRVSQHIQGLSPSTVYHYRVVASNRIAPSGFSGPTFMFSTQAGGGEFALPDGRAFEMVSPPNKHGALIFPIRLEEGVIQASASGGAITYATSAPTEAQPEGNTNSVQVLSARGPGGWSSRDIAIPHTLATGLSVGNGEEYRFFSEDLSLAVVQPFGAFDPGLSPEASEQTAYLRTLLEGGQVCEAPARTQCYQPLVSAANTPEGAKFGEEGKCPPKTICGPRFLDATPDASHVILESNVPLTATQTGSKSELYEWAAGRLALVSVQPNGKPANGPELGNHGRDTRGALSSDGLRVVWEAEHHLYMRVNALQPQSPLGGKGECTVPTDACTIQLDAVQGGTTTGQINPSFQLASSDGSRVLFTDEQRLTKDSGAGTTARDLYACEINATSCTLSDLTPLSHGEAGAVLGLVAGASEDASTVYFIANGVLENTAGERVGGAVPGSCRSGVASSTALCNLYVRHYAAGSWQTPKLVAVLSAEDSPDWSGGSQEGGDELTTLTARVSPDGGWLAFMSQRPLTGYDNHDAFSGQPDEEVYLYDAANEHLTCASCNPTGARPVGVEYSQIDQKLVGGPKIWRETTWIAANIPGWTDYYVGRALHQSRFLSGSGRLFFNSSDALVPQDVNGTEDVYEYEPVGMGSCGASTATFNEVSGGCTGLISSGQSKEESAFLDASETGGDVFLLTAAKLSSRDFDTALDVYDAHECTSASPCLPEEPERPPACTDESSCKAAASPQPEIFGAPPSSTFSGIGNIVPPTAPRTLTRAQKLAKALRVCHKQPRRKRHSCEAHARRTYGVHKATNPQSRHK